MIPDPKTSDNGRYTCLAARGSVPKSGGTLAQAREQVAKMCANVPVFDGGGRAATTTFAQRNIDDALVTFESEVELIKAAFPDNFTVVYPKRTILAENPVSVVDKVVDRKHTRKEAEAYLQWLYLDAGQEIAIRRGLRPRNAKILAAHARELAKVDTFTIDELFGNWKATQETHFDDGGTCDQMMAAAHRN